MIRIGLTGGIASGKTTVANWLKQQEIALIDADQIARQVVAPNEEGLSRIRAHFGNSVVKQDGSLDRNKLGQLVFSHHRKLKELNELLHPLIRARMKAQLADLQAHGCPFVFLDIPLLFESHLEDWVDRIVVVYVPQELQLRRLMARNSLDPQAATARIDAQLPLEEKARRADAVINNSGSLEATHEQLHQLMARWNLSEGSERSRKCRNKASERFS
ncbi:MAG: dephospho-CoA kinase [Sporolactobacillus sp.]